MKGLHPALTAALIMALSPGLTVRLTSGQAFPGRPESRYFWNYWSEAHPPESPMDQLPDGPQPQLGMDDTRKQLHPDLGLDFVEFYNTPEDQKRDFSRPLDTVGSAFIKKDQVPAQADDADVGIGQSKRSLDRLGAGLMKRPLDHLGYSLLKKRLHGSEGGEEVLPQTSAKDSSQDGGSQIADPTGRHYYDNKQSAVEMIKKGLDVLGSGLFKRAARGDSGSTQIRTALDQLSEAFGNGEDPAKGVDLDLVRRSLDHLGTGLLKRGLDSEGLGLIKRAVDNLDWGLTQRAPRKFLDSEGLHLLRKGLDHLQTDLVKAGFDDDAVRMVTEGAVSLASWLIDHRFGKVLPHYSKVAEQAKETYDRMFPGLGKKSLDTLGTGLIKKSGDSEDPVPVKDEDAKVKVFLDHPKERELKEQEKYNFKINNMHKFLDLQAAENRPPGAHAKARNDFNYGDIKAAFYEGKPEEKAAFRTFKAFSKDPEPETDKKGSDNVPSPLKSKKSLDEVGSGFIKKGLDQVGSGFIKKGLDQVGSGFIKKGLDQVGSGFIKKGLDQVGSGFIKKGLDEVGSGFIKKGLDQVGSGFIKKGLDQVGSGFIKKGLDEVGSGFIKKGLDEVGSGFIKKDLDYVGSGLMKKDSDAQVPQDLPHPQASVPKQQPPSLKPASEKSSSRVSGKH